LHTALLNSYLITEELPYTALDIQVVSKSLKKQALYSSYSK